MIGRLVQVVLGLVLLASSALAALPSASAASSWNLVAAGRFSPNGDGVRDTLSVRYRIPVDAHVYLTLSPAQDNPRPVRIVDLGEQPAGAHEWTWDGRDRSGALVLDGAYVISLHDVDPRVTFNRARAQKRVQVDTVLSAELVASTYGAELGAPARVFPRTTVVTDTLSLTASSEEKKLTSLELVIRDSRGRVVRRADVAEPESTANTGSYGHGRRVEWAAVRGGEPLPSGRYTAVVMGKDRAGNAGRSDQVRIWVSAEKLEWQERTVTVAPDASVVEECDYSTAMGCGDYTYCGRVVPSGLFPGGLSYRSAECAAPPHFMETQAVAASVHMLEVPEATGVRGLAAVRVSFTGAPTTAGKTDTGRLVVSGTTGSAVQGTSGQSAWIDDPSWGEGLPEDVLDGLPQRDPAALWTFVTTGTNSVDVASYTVDVRFLAVRDYGPTSLRDNGRSGQR